MAQSDAMPEDSVSKMRDISPQDSTAMWQSVAWLLLGLLAAGVAVQPRIAEDTWWHLAVGRWMEEHSAIPERDPFSAIDRPEGAPWRAYSWLFEWLMIQTHHVGGLDGLLFLKFALSACSTVAVCGYLGNRCRGKWTGPFLALIALPAFFPMFTERPWHMTIWGVLATLKALDEVLTRPTPLRRVLWLFPVYVFWANIHIQFVLGLGLLSAGLGVSWIRHRQQPGVSSIGTLMLLLPMCGLATLMNPYHFNIYCVVWEYATQTGALGLIDELKSPRIGDWWNWPLMALTLLALLRLLRDGLPLWEVALLLIGIFFACRMQRDCWFGTLLASRALLRPGFRVQQPYRTMVWPAIGFLIVKLVWMTGLAPHPTNDEMIRRDYPMKAVEWIKEHRPKGPLYNTFDWGGYLIWELPDYPVSMDGRTNLYGDERLLRSLQTWTTAEGRNEDPDFQKSQIVIAPTKVRDAELPLVSELRLKWRIAYEDETAIVFVRFQPN